MGQQGNEDGVRDLVTIAERLGEVAAELQEISRELLRHKLEEVSGAVDPGKARGSGANPEPGDSRPSDNPRRMSEDGQRDQGEGPRPPMHDPDPATPPGGG